VLQLPHAYQQISIGSRDRFVWGLSRPKIIRPDDHKRARISLCLQPCETWQRSTTSLRRLSPANSRCRAIASGEFSCSQRTLSFDARTNLSHLPQRETFVWRRSGLQRLPTLPHLHHFPHAAVGRRISRGFTRRHADQNHSALIVGLNVLIFFADSRLSA
jgi:hypothetical protein